MSPVSSRSVSHMSFSDRQTGCPERCLPPDRSRSTTGLPCLTASHALPRSFLMAKNSRFGDRAPPALPAYCSLGGVHRDLQSSGNTPHRAKIVERTRPTQVFEKELLQLQRRRG
jgi:hypothetical protein